MNKPKLDRGYTKLDIFTQLHNKNDLRSSGYNLKNLNVNNSKQEAQKNTLNKVVANVENSNKKKLIFDVKIVPIPLLDKIENDEQFLQLIGLLQPYRNNFFNTPHFIFMSKNFLPLHDGKKN